MPYNKNKNKIINSICVCKEEFYYTTKKIIMLEPCEHLIHVSCYTKSPCPFCKTPVQNITTFDYLKKNHKKSPELYQKYVDFVSIKNIDGQLIINNKEFVNVVDILGIASTVPFLNGISDGTHLCEEIFRLLNTKIIINGYKNIPKGPKVFIANHTTHLDMAVMLYVFKCGFLSSTWITKTFFGRLVYKIIPLLLINRGKSRNTVEKIKKYVDKHGSICIFPEGMCTHPDTIIRFRTGAFNTGHPVVPVVISYDPVIYHSDVGEFLKQFLVTQQLTVTVHILPPENQPFDEAKIEKIRYKMGAAGNMACARTTSRGIVDGKNTD